MSEKTLTEDQDWCLARATGAKWMGAPTVEKLLLDAASCPDKARICREEMMRASQASKRIRGSGNA